MLVEYEAASLKLVDILNQCVIPSQGIRNELTVTLSAQKDDRLAALQVEFDML